MRSLHDVAKANLLFGGRHAVLREVRALLEQGRNDDTRVDRSGSQRGNATDSRTWTLLDVGTGIGDIPASSARAAHRRSIELRTIGLEITPSLARAARPACTWCAVGDALRLPFADGSIDIVTCSQVLHHFDGEQAEALLRECTRVSRAGVVIADLRRSWLAVGGLWLSSFVLRFHPVSRNDGIVSILRGYTTDELRALVLRSTGATPVVRHAPGWRLTAVWSPATHAQSA